MGASSTERGAKVRAAETERARCAWLLAADLASKSTGADVRVVMQTRGTPGRGSHDPATTEARKIACYLATVVANVTGARLSDASGIDRSTILVHAHWVEDQREDPDYDAKISALESTLVDMALRVVMAARMAMGAQLESAA